MPRFIIRQLNNLEPHAMRHWSVNTCDQTMPVVSRGMGFGLYTAGGAAWTF
jgi:hypothetical protein